MNRHLLSLTLFFGFALNCSADDVPSLKIGAKDANNELALSAIQSIKFSDTEMLVNLKNGTQKAFALNDITIVEFGKMTSAIKNILQEEGQDGEFTITDISGKVISKGKTTDNINGIVPEKRGLFIVRSGKVTKKILVK